MRTEWLQGTQLRHRTPAAESQGGAGFSAPRDISAASVGSVPC